MSMLKGLLKKDFKQVGRYITVRCILLIRAFNLVATYITVRCSFAKPQKRILGGSNTQGAAPRNLGSTEAKMFLSGAAHRNLLPVLTNTPKPHAGFIPLSAHFNSNLALSRYKNLCQSAASVLSVC